MMAEGMQLGLQDGQRAVALQAAGLSRVGMPRLRVGGPSAAAIGVPAGTTTHGRGSYEYVKKVDLDMRRSAAYLTYVVTDQMERDRDVRAREERMRTGAR